MALWELPFIPCGCLPWGFPVQMGPGPPGSSAPQPGVPACAAQRHTTLRDPSVEAHNTQGPGLHGTDIIVHIK